MKAGQIVLIEDNPADALLVAMALTEAGGLVLSPVRYNQIAQQEVFTPASLRRLFRLEAGSPC